MMSTNSWLKRAAAAGALGLVCGGAADVWAADATVPLSWNAAPMTSGAYLESFDTLLPMWAGRVGVSIVTNVFPAMGGSSLPVRSNAWFGATNVKVMQLDTEGAIVTNTVAYEGEAAVSFAAKPVFVDMRVRFDALTEAPSAQTLADSKVAVFVSEDTKLVVVHANGWTTNSVALDTNRWYQLTFKMLNGKVDVLLNDQPVPAFTGLDLMNVGASTLTAASFRGTGLIDELYVSHGDPAYAVTGPTGSIPTLPADGANIPSDEQQTRINVWLDGQNAITSLGTMTQDQLSEAYMIDELAVTEGVASPVDYSFGIAKIELVSETQLVITLGLYSDNGDKNGPINGRVQLQGKASIGDAWTTLSGAITPENADFVSGMATYTFSIPGGGYKYFRPLIVP